MTVLAFAVAVALLWTGGALVASALRLDSFTSFGLAVYLIACAELVGIAEVLSLQRRLTLNGYLLCEGVLSAVAVGCWWHVGRPFPPRPALPSMRALRRHRVLVGLACCVALALIYELVLGLTTPPNNWDSLWYHLARVAAWRQNHGIAYIEPVNNELLNAYPPGGEMQVLFAVLPGFDSLATIPQFAAEVVLLGSIYGIARRVRFPRAASAFAALLFATLAVVALEAVTTQNDLCVAACISTATFFILGSARRELILAGLAIGLAVGTKFTTLFALPAVVLVAIAARRRRRDLVELCGWSTAAIAAFGAFGYVLNLISTGHLGGNEDDTVRAQFAPMNAASTAARALYRFVDLSGTRPFIESRAWAATALGFALVALGIAAFKTAAVRGGPAGARTLTLPAVAGALVIVVPIAAVAVATAGRAAITLAHIPLQPRGATANAFDFGINSRANEDVSYFGPLGLFLIWPTAIVTLGRYRRSGLNPRIALAAALPLFLIALAIGVRYSLWLGRFFIIPVALVMPLCATVYQRRNAALLAAVTGAMVLLITQVFNEAKPVGLGADRSVWSLSRAEAESLMRPSVRGTLEHIAQDIPARASIGVLLWPGDWSYPLYGPGLRRHVRFLAHPISPTEAAELRLAYLIEHRRDSSTPDGRWTIIRVRPALISGTARTGRARA